MSKREIIRRLRVGDLQKFLRFRYGHTLPDDDAGREDLFELLIQISIGPEGERKMENAIEVLAPWMNAAEASQTIDRINRTPAHLRKRTARELGNKLRVTNAEREALKLKTVKPFDMTDGQLKELRKAKDRTRQGRRRRAKGKKARVEYLANSLTILKPWKVEGISRRTWFRRRKLGNGTGLSKKQKHRGTGASAIKLITTADTLVPRSKVQGRKSQPKGNGRDRTKTTTDRTVGKT